MTMTARGLQTGLLLALFTTLPLFAQAKTLGVVGHIFPIGEIDMLDWIDQRLRTFAQNGEMDAMKKRMQSRVKASVRRPAPVA
ncbi:type-F conjugative transfer system protein TraW, partial [Photobacterium frigidiphilum]